MLLNFIKKLFGLSPVVTEAANHHIKNKLAEGAVIVDVRTAREFAGEHVESSINIPLAELSRQLSKVQSYQKPVVVCCASGHRSKQAVVILKANGMEAHNGGSWREVQDQLANW